MNDLGLVVENDVMAEMRDGVRLRADVFRPAAVQDRLPVLVQRNPYSTRDGIWAMLGQAVAQQGYAVVVQSCRGRYGSEGDFSPIQPDVEDGCDTVEWADDLEITGPVSVQLWASSSVESTDFTAKLIEVFADGQSATLGQGVVRTGVGVAHPRTPGAAYRCEIDLWATSVVVKAGHRLRLHVSSSEYSTYDLNPNTGLRITHDGSGETVPATQHVFHDELHPSCLILPVIPVTGQEEGRR